MHGRRLRKLAILRNGLFLMEQLNLLDLIEKKEPQEEKPAWINSSYQPLRPCDLVEYNPAGMPRTVGLVTAVYPANVYEGAACEILEKNGGTVTLHTKWVRKVT